MIRLKVIDNQVTAKLIQAISAVKGDPGQDGVSPTITVTDITDGHRVMITDATGTHSFDVMDGAKGDKGNKGDDYTLTAADKTEIAGMVDVSSKIDEPATEGTSGQVLTTDGQGGRSWQTVQGSGAVQDVQVNGSSVLDAQGVANVPIAKRYNQDGGALGVVSIGQGLMLTSAGMLFTDYAPQSVIKNSGSYYTPITPFFQHISTFYGLAKAAGSDEKNSTLPVGQYTESAKSAISEMLGGAVEISGTTPTINALPGVRYACGEVSTLDVIAPATGCIDVVFQSGSTPTVLTITPPTGMTVEWTNGFDSTALEADTMYEISIKMVGTKCLGVAGSWT